MDFIPYFILRGFEPVHMEQNILLAPQLGLSLANFIARNFARSGPCVVLTHFAFSFVLCCLLRFV